MYEKFKLLKRSLSNQKEPGKKRAALTNLFDSLPDEAILEIFGFFNKFELTNVALTCHKFNRLTHDKSIWQKAPGIKDYKKMRFPSKFRMLNDNRVSAICKLDAKRIVIGDNEGLIRIIEVTAQRWQEILQMQCPNSRSLVNKLQVDARGNIIALMGDSLVKDHVYIFDGKSGKLIYQYDNQSHVQILSNGTIFSCYRRGGDCYVIHSYDSRYENLRIETDATVKSITLDKKDNLVLGLFNGKILILSKDFKTNILIHEESSPVLDLQILPNGNILSVHGNKKAYEWNPLTGKQEKKYPENLILNSNIILPDGNIISYSDTRGKIIDSQSQEELSTFAIAPMSTCCEQWLITFGDNDIIITDSINFYTLKFGYKIPAGTEQKDHCEHKHTAKLQ